MAWTLYKEVRYAAPGIPSSSLTDFPKLVTITTDADIAAELGGGGGIKFTSADGGTDLDFGLYPSTALASGTVVARVRVSPASTANAGDVLCRLYYSSAESTTEDKAGTVSNGYVVFMPMEEDPSGGAPQMLDWVTNTNRGTSEGTMTSGDLVAGQVGSGLDHDASDDGVALPTSLFASATLTYETWVNPAAINSYYFMLSCYTSDGDAMELAIHAEGGNGSLGGGNYNNWARSNAVLSASAWQKVDLTSSGGTTQLYLDGATTGSTGSTNFTTFTPATKVGKRTTGGFPFSGVIDEVKLSSVARAAAWLAYAFADEDNNGATFTLSAEQGGGGGGAVGPLVGGKLVRGGILMRGRLVG
jgi:hypothetical protein